MLRKLLCSLLMSAWVWTAIAAEIPFRHISSDGELSSVCALAITQDRDGYMWFASLSGLERYDGYRTRSFSSDKIISKSTSYICTDGKGNILCDFNELLAVCDGERISTFCTPDGKTITSIVPVSPERTVVVTSGNTYMFEGGVFTEAVLPSPLNGDRPVIINRQEDGDGVICLSASGSLWFWNTSSGTAVHIATLPENVCAKCLHFFGGTVWLGTEGQGLFGIRVEDGRIENFTMSAGELPSDYVRSVGEDSAGRLLVGTLEGLAIRDTDNWTTIKNKSDDPSSLSYNSVRSIYRDRDGGMWIGTFYGGINYYHSDAFSFKRTAPINGPHTSDENIISSIAPDSVESSVWMGFGHSGIARYTPSEDRIEIFDFPKGKGRSYDVKALLPDPLRERIWVGSRLGGFGFLDTKTGNYNNVPMPARDILAILQDGNDGMLLCTEKGLISYDIPSGTVEAIAGAKVSASTRFLWRDASGDILTGPELKVFRKGEDGNISEVTDFPLSSRRGIHSFYESPAGMLFFSSSSALFRYNQETGEVREFGQKEGLPSKIRTIIGEDREERLWLGLANGVCCFNCETGAFKLFGKDHGISPEWYIKLCSCSLPDGTFCMGTVDGLITFRPEAIMENSFSPTPVISSLKTNGGMTDEDISEGSVILPHNRNSLDFTFATFNYMSAGNERFACLLEGAEKEWRYVDRTNTVSYTMLPPGKYTFRVRAANGDGIWSEGEATVKVTVRPEFLRSPIFRVMLSLLILFTGIYNLLALIREREKRIRLQERREILRKKSASGIEHRLTQEEAAFLEKAKAIVEDNISNVSFSVDDFAREMGISRAGLYTKVKLVSGCSPMDLLMEERWKVACRLLKESGRSVADIAEDVGFSTASYFTRAFKKRFGVLPSVYRKG